MASVLPFIERIDCWRGRALENSATPAGPGSDDFGRRHIVTGVRSERVRGSGLLNTFAGIMLINLVKDSVLQCFCHTCRAPLPPAARRAAPIKKAKTKSRSKQPKKVKFITTEIRCQEKSKGGLAYEVILAEPVAVTPPKRPISPSSKVSVENIDEKLKAAEERRLSIEANKMALLAAKMSKIEEASKKKDEQANTFILQTREALEQKMETHTEKREAHLSDLKAKLKDHLESVEKIRLSIELQTNEVRNAVEEKLKVATAQRDENIKKMLDRLKEHEEQAQRVRTGMLEKVKQLESQIQSKLELAQTRREQLEQEQLEKLRNHERRAEMVRQNKERLTSQNDEQQTASSG
ncbi:angiomotin-like 2a isoform X2 [Zootermopsis nevadensis]|uniref:angiomotin-like 2a isoform X2 n=1 Tax=Zootermopsis nevadensis TaxID=136037 RepID=UPI000B8EE3F3|nr:angiomotin-like 2a isoform X2 [Zootermopsis nevadensis]